MPSFHSSCRLAVDGNVPPQCFLKYVYKVVPGPFLKGPVSAVIRTLASKGPIQYEYILCEHALRILLYLDPRIMIWHPNFHFYNIKGFCLFGMLANCIDAMSVSGRIGWLYKCSSTDSNHGAQILVSCTFTLDLGCHDFPRRSAQLVQAMIQDRGGKKRVGDDRRRLVVGWWESRKPLKNHVNMPVWHVWYKLSWCLFEWK